MAIHYPKNPRTFSSVSNVGEKWRKKYIKVIGENGVPRLECVGEENITEEIQRWADSCDINLIIEQCTGGKTSHLSAREVANILRMDNNGMYVDMSDAPKSLVEAYNVLDKAKSLYDSLDESVKSSYGSYEQFLAASDYSAFIPKKEVTADA